MDTIAEVDVAASFVELVMKYDWKNSVELPEDEVKVLLDTVTAAGFDPKKVVFGKLVGDYRDQDGSATGETYPINSLCPYKVIGQGGGVSYHATGWLDQALRRVLYGARRQEDRSEFVEAITTEIRRSVPLEPIQFTVDGDLLREYPPSGDYFVNHTRDDQQLDSCAGVHDYCRGWVDRGRATKTHDALICRSCHLRILFPKEIKTYGELRGFFKAKIGQVVA